MHGFSMRRPALRSLFSGYTPAIASRVLSILSFLCASVALSLCGIQEIFSLREGEPEGVDGPMGVFALTSLWRKYTPPPFCLLEWIGGECFQSFASISNRVFVIRISAGGRRSGEASEASGCHRVTEFTEVLLRLR